MSSKKVFGSPDQDLEVHLAVGREARVKRGLTVWTESVAFRRRQGSWVRKSVLGPRPLPPGGKADPMSPPKRSLRRTRES